MHHSMFPLNPLIISGTRSLNFAWHRLWRSTTENKNMCIVKLLAITKPFTPCAARMIIFQRENVNFLIVCFTQCFLFFQKVCFPLPICSPCVICGQYVRKINALLRHKARQTFASLSFLRSHVLRAYCNFESKQANSITLYGRRPNNKFVQVSIWKINKGNVWSVNGSQLQTSCHLKIMLKNQVVHSQISVMLENW